LNNTSRGSGRWHKRQESSQDSDGGFEHTNDAKKKKTVIGMIAPPKPRFTNSCDNPLSMMIMGGGSCNGHGTAELFHPKNISSTSAAAVDGQ
jgi:hypothetical protein